MIVLARVMLLVCCLAPGRWLLTVIIIPQPQPQKAGVVESKSAHAGVPPVQPCSGGAAFPTTVSEQLGRLEMEEGGPGSPALKEPAPFSPSQAYELFPKRLETPSWTEKPWRTFRRQRKKMPNEARHKKPPIVRFHL